MIRLLANGLRVGFFSTAIAVTIPMFVFAQDTESRIERLPVPSEQGMDDANAAGGDKGSKTGKTMQAVTPLEQVISARDDVEIQSRFNEIRRALLDRRANTIDSWLAVTALVLTFFGIVVVIAGFFGYRRFREVLNEAREGAKAAAQNAEVAANHAQDAARYVREIEKNLEISREKLVDMNAETAAINPEQANQAVEAIQNNPRASVMDKAIANAFALQRHSENEKAVEKWQAIASTAEEIDNALAARAWFSIGFLLRNESLEKSILALDKSIRLNPNIAHAYNDRGTAKFRLNQHEAALIDYDDAIRLNPDFAIAYHNRGNTKAHLNILEAALADYDEAIRLNPQHDHTFHNRGKTKARLNRYEAAMADYDEAIRLNPDYANAYYNRGIAWLLRKEYEKVRSDLSDAKSRGMDIATVFSREYDSVAEFEKQYGINVSEGIKKMLEP